MEDMLMIVRAAASAATSAGPLANSSWLGVMNHGKIIVRSTIAWSRLWNLRIRSTKDDSVGGPELSRHSLSYIHHLIFINGRCLTIIKVFAQVVQGIEKDGF
jgi:hypothetical protein